MSKWNFWSLFAIAMLVVLSWGGTRIIDSYQFNKNAGGHLQRAANANTVELAKQELETALNYIKVNNLTSGSTYILFDTPDKDIGYWYGNLKSSLDELNKVDSKTSQLEKTNLLMKLRETLTDQNSDGTQLIIPAGISIYPHNLIFSLWASFGFILLAVWLGIGIKKMADL